MPRVAFVGSRSRIAPTPSAASPAIIAKAREQQLLAVQIEDEAGVAMPPRSRRWMASMSCFVGPGDLSANMGAMGNPGAAHVQEAIASVRKAAAAAGRASGILASVKADAGPLFSPTASPWLLSVPTSVLLARGSDALVASFKQ